MNFLGIKDKPSRNDLSMRRSVEVTSRKVNMKLLEKSFEEGSLDFETLESLNDAEASYLYRTKILHTKLPTLP
jgi:hypothetical protein